MTCIHCNELVTTFLVCRSVIMTETVLIVDENICTQQGFTIELPRGKSNARYRCGVCGGDLPEKPYAGLYRKGKKP